MALYIVSYDLLNKKTFGDYEELIAELKRLGAQKILYSDWGLNNDATSVVIRDHLRKFMHADDRILVAEIGTTNWASYKLLFNIKEL